MAFPHAPLSNEQLGPGVSALFAESAAPQMRMMAARGLAPLPARDMLVALYQLWATNSDNLAEIAGKTTAGLPIGIVSGALADPNLPQGVIDLLGRRQLANDSVLDAVVRHPNVADETLASVGLACSEPICDILAENQSRWRAYPKIVVSLYSNRNCRQSVVHRMLETAVRANIEIDLPMMEEIREALGVSKVNPERDIIFAKTVENTEVELALRKQVELALAPTGTDEHEFLQALPLPEIDPEAEHADPEAAAVALLETSEPEKRRSRHAEIRLMEPMEKIRAALLGTASDRAVLVRDTNKTVAMAAIKCPRVTDAEAVAYSADRSLSNDVIRYLANKREWIKLYAVKLNLVMNPKTPMSRAMALLVYLQRRDIQKVSRSKNVSSALAKAAKRKVTEAG